MDPTALSRNITLPLFPPGGIEGKTSGDRGTTWTPSTTFSGVEQPLNRQQRRAQQKLAERRNGPAHSQVRVKLTRDQIVARIKEEREKKGLPPAARDQRQDDTVTHVAVTWVEWGTETLHKGVQLLKQAVQWSPGGNLGAEAASTCEVDGSCKAPASIQPPPMTISDFKKLLGGTFSMERSPSLRKREDQTLRNVVVVVADPNHYDPEVQAAITSLVQRSIHPDDRLLVEQPKDPGFYFNCRDVLALGAQCHAIDTSSARAEIDAAFDELMETQARIVEFAIGKTLAWPDGKRKPSREELKKLGYQRLTDLVLEHTKITLAPYTSIFNEEEIETLGQLSEADSIAGEKFRALLIGGHPAREASFRDEIEHHAAGADGHATFVILGVGHVDNMKTWLLESLDAIVLHTKDE